MQRIARMGQAAGIGNRVEYPKFVPVHHKHSYAAQWVHSAPKRFQWHKPMGFYFNPTLVE
jgi:hypothetical protein